MFLLEMKLQLIRWMNQMKHGYRDSNIYMEIEDKGRIRIVMCTKTNKYTIVAVCPRENQRSYFGASVSSRTPRAGEDWCRGNDLADGDFSLETWIKILSDIVGYELVKIHRPVQHKSDWEEIAIVDGTCHTDPIANRKVIVKDYGE